MATKAQIQRQAAERRKEKEEEAQYKRRQKEEERQRRYREEERQLRKKEAIEAQNEATAEQLSAYIDGLDKLHQVDIDIDEALQEFTDNLVVNDFIEYKKLSIKRIPREIDTENLTTKEYIKYCEQHGIDIHTPHGIVSPRSIIRMESVWDWFNIVDVFLWVVSRVIAPWDYNILPSHWIYCLSKIIMILSSIVTLIYFCILVIAGGEIEITIMTFALFVVFTISTCISILFFYRKRKLSVKIYTDILEENKIKREEFFKEQKRLESENYVEYLRQKDEYIKQEEFRIDMSRKALNGDNESRAKLASLIFPQYFPIYCPVELPDNIYSSRVGFYSKGNAVYVGIYPPSKGIVPLSRMNISGVRKSVTFVPISEKDRDILYERFKDSFILATCMYILYNMPFMKKVYLDAYEDYTDPSTGQTSRQIFVSIAFDSECLKTIKFSKADASAVYSNLTYEYCEPGEKSDIKGYVKHDLLVWG